MFGFNLWSGFGAFRDPLTITQNMTFTIPPKTTIGGMLAAILGLDYRDYMNDPDFFSFGYSLIPTAPVRKKSFAQNYIEDYTKKSVIRLNSMLKLMEQEEELISSLNRKNELKTDVQSSVSEMKKIEGLEKEIESGQKKLNMAIDNWIEKTSGSYPKSKPIFRELLINPSYLVFIHRFRHETDIVKFMRNHESAYPLYMGNSEFPANYRFIECLSWKPELLKELDSFTGSPEKIAFEAGKKYTSTYAATRTTGEREYRDFRHVVVCDQKMALLSPVDGYAVKTEDGDFQCEFI